VTTSDPDIWRAAALLIEQHGKNAQLVAFERQAEMLVMGDLDGAEMWSRIKQAINEPQALPIGRAH